MGINVFNRLNDTRFILSLLKWDDQAINRDSNKAIFRVENNVSLVTWVSYLYIGF